MFPRAVPGFAVALIAAAGPASARAPEWLRELAAVQLPEQGPEVDAVRLLNQVDLIVDADGKMRKHVRVAVRILRREGEARAIVQAPQDAWRKVRDLRGWAIPVNGKESETRPGDVREASVVNVAGSELITDLRMKLLRIPDAAPGVTIGYEYDVTQTPLEMADTFGFQEDIPVREASYSLRLPAAWNMSPNWVNHAAVEAVEAGTRRWQWTIRNVPAVTSEPGMPAWKSIAGHLFVSFSPPGQTPQLSTWVGIGSWYLDLSKDRRVASDEIRGKVASLVAGSSTDLDKMRALADFVQREVRYVGIQLGIGGYQPHAAADVFQSRYGDCKDKATLLGVMLAEIGIQSIPVIINTERSRVRADMPASMQFNHVILAIRLPPDVQSPSLLATLGQDGDRLLFFDPTDELTPFGRIRGELQGNTGLLALVENARLVTLPQLRPEHSGASRTARMTLNAQGLLAGQVSERILGQEALLQRGFLRSTRRESDTAKVVESRLASSLASFQLADTVLRNRESTDLPLEWEYRISAPAYARAAGDLLMVRPRVIGVMAADLPSGGRPRVHDLLLPEPRVHQDEVIIELPAGYVVDALPEPVDVDAGFAAYRSRTEVTGSQLRYTRRYEVRELTIPAARVEAYRRLQNEIARDERAMAVFKRAP